MSIQDITVVVTSFKSSEKITNCLKSIDRQCKIILVENSSDLIFKEKIEKEFCNVECILTGKNLGYGKANNIALKRVNSKYALILNPDAFLYSSTFENFFKTVKQIPDFAIMGPYIQQKVIGREMFNLEKSYPISVKSIKGFAMFLNISKFKDIGFFDENFFIYFEEIDLCRRIIDSNEKIYIAPAIKIKHEGGQSHDKSFNKAMELSRNWHWMWSTFYYHKKYKGFFISFLIVLPKLSSAIFKILLYSLLSNKEKKEIYYHRYLGLKNGIVGKSSWYRPNV